MQKVVSYLFLVIILGGCAPVKVLTDSESDLKEKNIRQVIEGNNISSAGFAVPKAEIVFLMDGSEQKLLSNIKFDGKGNFLISLRSSSGFEALRILITNDSIKANDRINRKFYTGSDDYILWKYGIRKEMLILFFGDLLIAQNNNYISECINGEATITGAYKNFSLKYTASCNNGKVTESFITDARGKASLTGRYSKFRQSESFKFPQIGHLIIQPEGIEIKFRIKNVEEYSGEELNLVRGRDYDKIILR